MLLAAADEQNKASQVHSVTTMTAMADGELWHRFGRCLLSMDSGHVVSQYIDLYTHTLNLVLSLIATALHDYCCCGLKAKHFHNYVFRLQLI